MSRVQSDDGRTEAAEHSVGDALLSSALADFRRDGVASIVALRVHHPEQYLMVMAAVMRMKFRTEGAISLH